MPTLDALLETSRGKLQSIQYVRAVAALIVVVWHTGWARTVVGQSGVDLFFVVSGFVMMLVSGRERSPARFALARLARIVPLYWAVTIVVAYLDRSSISAVVSSLLFFPDRPYPVVLQGWSLDLEMSYYLMFASTLMVSSRWQLPLLAGEFGFVCILMPSILPGNVPVAAWSNPLAFEFLAGALLYTVWRRQELPTGGLAWAIGLAGVVTLAATHLLGGGPVGWPRVFLWGMPALAIVAAGLGIERAGQLPRLPLLGILGEASFSIYLTHRALLDFISGPLHTLWAPVAVTVAVVLACVVGWAVHRIVELPMHRLTNAWLRSRWTKSQPARP